MVKKEENILREYCFSIVDQGLTMMNLHKEVNLSVFVYTLFHENFSPLDKHKWINFCNLCV